MSKIKRSIDYRLEITLAELIRMIKKEHPELTDIDPAWQGAATIEVREKTQGILGHMEGAGDGFSVVPLTSERATRPMIVISRTREDRSALPARTSEPRRKTSDS